MYSIFDRDKTSTPLPSLSNRSHYSLTINNRQAQNRIGRSPHVDVEDGDRKGVVYVYRDVTLRGSSDVDVSP